MIGWLPAPAARDVELATPRPAYQPDTFRGTVRPETIPEHLKTRATTAASHALKTFPGPAGEILAAELRSYAELGYLANSSSAISRLIDQLMTEPLPPNIQ